MTQSIRLTDEEIEIVRQSLKALELTFCKGYPPFQAALMKSAFYRVLYKFNPEKSASCKKTRKPRKPRSLEPLIMEQICDPIEVLFDNLRDLGIEPSSISKIFNPCAGTNQGVLSHLIKRRDVTLILNEEEDIRLSIPVDSSFSPSLQSEWDAWKSKGYLSDWVVFEPPNNEDKNKIIRLAILCPAELLLPMSPLSTFIEGLGFSPNPNMSIDGSAWFHDSVWLVLAS